MSIPRTVFQAWVGPNPIPQREAGWCALMKKLNPDFKVVLFGNELLDRYGKDPYVQELLARKSAWAFIADRLRCLLLAEEGGIWLDPDCQPLRPLNRLDRLWNDPSAMFAYGNRSPLRPAVIAGRQTKPVALHRGTSLIDDTFLASAPGSKMIKRILELWTPASPLIDGHAIGVQILQYCDPIEDRNTGWKYFYSIESEPPHPDALVSHDRHNLGTWVDLTKKQKGATIAAL